MYLPKVLCSIQHLFLTSKELRKHYDCHHFFQDYLCKTYRWSQVTNINNSKVNTVNMTVHIVFQYNKFYYRFGPLFHLTSSFCRLSFYGRKIPCCQESTVFGVNDFLIKPNVSITLTFNCQIFFIY